jgi:hypothetical protein
MYPQYIGGRVREAQCLKNRHCGLWQAFSACLTIKRELIHRIIHRKWGRNYSMPDVFFGILDRPCSSITALLECVSLQSPYALHHRLWGKPSPGSSDKSPSGVMCGKKGKAISQGMPPRQWEIDLIWRIYRSWSGGSFVSGE